MSKLINQGDAIAELSARMAAILQKEGIPAEPYQLHEAATSLLANMMAARRTKR